MLSLTAQAFLFTIALNTGFGTAARAIAAGLALIAALASAQLLLKHRAFEHADAKWLYEFEVRRGLERVNRKRELAEIPQRWRASDIWLGVLLLFGVAAAYVLVSVLF